ncbi:beta-lactamase family protein [Bacillus paramycoides]|uniref:serine hydrolase domain-containing protein n=1 Tax=Bacillus paramycoides TaxID=2026194 RepID=UPI002244D131|nr:serine hydrolase domain-containing protein [Bacillus paramycoides]MCW9129761.1 beta-lactamase family protein [Bacillus paramycoides]
MKEKALLQRYMSSLAEASYFNGTVLIAKNDEILLSEAFGTANFTHNIPHTIDTKFRIGSLTKAFTCTAILQLEERGLLSVVDSITKYIKGFSYGEDVSIHHLLTHTSGISNFTSWPNYWSDMMRKPISKEEMVQLLKTYPLEFKPGEKYSYTNSGYILLTIIIEKITGLSYKEYIHKYICQPLQMHNTGCEDESREIVKSLSTGYTIYGDVIQTEYIDMSIPLGAYGMYSTVKDLFKWHKALRRSEVISDASRQKMFTAYLNHYGYGWAITQEREGNTSASHFGDINGFVNYMIRYEKDNICIIVLSNINITPVIEIAKNIAEIINGEEVQMPLPIKKFERNFANKLECVGKYVTENNEVIQIIETKNKLYVIVPKRYGVLYKLELHFCSLRDEVATFRTTYVDEKIEINTKTGLLRYKDVMGKCIKANKISSDAK